MKLKISDEIHPELKNALREKNYKLICQFLHKNHFESDSEWTIERCNDSFIQGFRAAESHHQSKVDKLMQIVEMQREALEHYEDTSYFKVDGVDSQGYEIENEYFIAADAMLETDKMLKELNDQK